MSKTVNISFSDPIFSQYYVCNDCGIASFGTISGVEQIIIFSEVIWDSYVNLWLRGNRGKGFSKGDVTTQVVDSMYFCV